MKQKKAEGIIGYVVVIIIAFFMVTIIWGQTRTATTIATYDENMTLTIDVASSLTYDDLVSGTTTVTNSSNQTFIEDEHFNMSIQYGRVTLNSVSVVSTGDYWVNYSYYPDSYNKNATGRTLTTLLGVLVAIGLLVLIVRKITSD